MTVEPRANFFLTRLQKRKRQTVPSVGFTTIKGPLESLLPQTLALVQAMNPAPDPARIALINTTIAALISGGQWALLDVLHVYAAHAPGPALLNWLNPNTFAATLINAPLFTTDRGFTSNGTTSSVGTTYVASTNAINFAQDNASAWCWNRADVTFGNSNFGKSGNPTISLGMGGGSNTRILRMNDNTASVMESSITDRSGFFGSQRTTSTHKRLFRNGTVVGADVAVASVGVPDAQLTMGVPFGNTGAGQYSMFAIGAGLAGLESGFDTIMRAYMTAVGA